MRSRSSAIDTAGLGAEAASLAQAAGMPPTIAQARLTGPTRRQATGPGTREKQETGGRGMDGLRMRSSYRPRCEKLDPRRACIARHMKSVKSADRPDSVRSLALRRGTVTAIPLGRLSPERLGATYPHTPRDRSTCAYLVLLRAEIARFTRSDPKALPTRLCCSDPHLAVERCYLLRYPVQSGPSSSAPFRALHQRRSG